jgi:hypothetical protein
MKAEPGSKLARLRQEAHRAFDVYWEFGGVTRSQAYARLAAKLNMQKDQCHIGLFDEETCQRVIELCQSEGIKAGLS